MIRKVLCFAGIVLSTSLLSSGILNAQSCEWESVSPQIVIDTANADTFQYFNKSPASKVAYCFASFIRGDEKWEKVAKPDMIHPVILKNYRKWNFLEVKLLETCQVDEYKLWLKVEMTVETGRGQPEEGRDEVTLNKIDGEWYITDLPS
jgi:hypothetical protein